MKPDTPKGLIVEAARHLYNLGLCPGSGGNVSLCNGQKIFITPTGVSFRDLTEKEVSVLDREGNLLNGPTPSSEFRMHLSIYQCIPVARAVCHVHGCHTIAYSILARPGDSIPAITPGLALAGKVLVLPLLLPGSEELAETVKATILELKAKAVLLKNHGAVCIGQSLPEAINLCEEIEAGLKIWFLAREDPQPLPERMVQLIRNQYGSRG